MPDSDEKTTQDSSPDKSETRQSPPDISLCLSGGGYRAAIFHLGALRWLNERGVLSRLKKISCVSGGSIIGAHLAYRFRDGWPQRPLSIEQWVRRIEEPFWRFVNRDIRTWPIVVRFIWPPNWFRSWSTVECLRRQYAKHLFEDNDLPLAQLNAGPELVLCATDMAFGVNWEAGADRVGDFEAGYAKPPPGDWTLARGVAASSCFPPIFPPARTMLSPSELKPGKYREADRDEKVAGIRLTDGGVYDNLGLQPAFYDEVVLASDGGGTLEFTLLHLPWRRLARYPALLQNGIGKLRKSWLIRDFKSDPPRKQGTYWGIADGSKHDSPFYNDRAARLIASIRTDLNRFTRPEFEILLNHGYLSAAEKTTRYASQLLENLPSLKEVKAPYPDWQSVESIELALRRSASRWTPYCLR